MIFIIKNIVVGWHDKLVHEDEISRICVGSFIISCKSRVSLTISSLVKFLGAASVAFQSK